MRKNYFLELYQSLSENVQNRSYLLQMMKSSRFCMLTLKKEDEFSLSSNSQIVLVSKQNQMENLCKM